MRPADDDLAARGPEACGMDSTANKGQLMEAMTNSIAIPAPATKTETSVPAGERTLPQLSLGGVIAVWAAAALPMGLLAWFVAPRLADHLSGGASLPRALMITLTGGLIWQFVLVMALVRREQGT